MVAETTDDWLMAIHSEFQPSPATSTAAPLVRAEDLGVRRGRRWLIRGVGLTVHPGEIVTLIGPNGSGKSTTVKAVLGLIGLDEGKTERKPGTRIGYVPQQLSIDWTLPLTLHRFMSLTRHYGETDIDAALDQTGIIALKQTPVQALSGGEFQRALIARALIQKPDLLVLDEPVQNVDFSGEIELYELIGHIRDRLGCGILLVSHDLHIVMAATDTVICLNQHVCCSGTPQAVAADPAYRALFGAKAAETIAVYRHDHDHTDAEDGTVVPLAPGDRDDA